MNTLSLPALETLLSWSEPREVQTKYGPRMLRKSTPEDGSAFWALWAQHKEELKHAGLSVSKDLQTGAWQICWWAHLDAQTAEQRAANLAASRAASSDFDPPRPDGLEFYPFQKAGIEFAIGKPGCYIADEMGLGKGIQAIGVINCLPEIKRVLVVTKASLKENWRRELVKWLVEPRIIGIAEAQYWPRDSHVVIINYDVLMKHTHALRSEEWDLVILDESANIKNRKTKRAISVIGFVPTKKAQADGEQIIPPIPAKRRLALSGTPIENRPEEIWSTLHFLDPLRWRSFWSFAKRYCNMNSGSGHIDTGGASNLDELQRILRETCMIRRLKMDVLKELPPKIRVVVEMDTEGLEEVIAAEKRAFQKHERELITAQAELEVARAEETNEAFREAVKRMASTRVAFTEIARVRHDTAVAKVPALIEFLKEDLEETSKMLIFCCHHDVIDALYGALNAHLSLQSRGPIRSLDSNKNSRSEKSTMPVQMRTDAESGSGFANSIRESGLSQMQTTETRESRWKTIRKMDRDFQRSTESSKMQMPVRNGAGSVSRIIDSNKVERLHALSPKEARPVSDTNLQDASTGKSQGQEIRNSVQPSSRGYAQSAPNLPIARNSHSVQPQKSIPQQSIAGSKNPTTGICAGQCLDYKLASERNKKQCLADRTEAASSELGKRFRYVAVIDGRTPAETRQSICDIFQNTPECRVLLGSIRACGEGLTLTAANLVVFVEQDWAPGKMSQAEDRAHRIGQKDNVLIKHYVIPGTIDAKMIKTTIEKQEIIEKALDLDPGAWAAEPVFAPSKPLGKRSEIQEEGMLMTSSEQRAAHAGLRQLALFCDGAQALDGAGFSKVDANIGHQLASRGTLTPGQAALGRRLCRRYQKQLSPDLLAAMGVRAKTEEQDAI